MNNLVERLRLVAKPTLASDKFESSLLTETADLIEQQAERIKELEAACSEYRQVLANAVFERDTLRHRIADAPVVAEVGSVQGQTAYVFQTSDRTLLVGTKLISKEDLQK